MPKNQLSAITPVIIEEIMTGAGVSRDGMFIAF
jgi:hypothetical protein